MNPGRHFCLSALAALLPLQAGAERLAAPADAEALGAEVGAFLESFIDPAKTPEQQAAYFAEHADYYRHGMVGHAHIERDVAYYMRRWRWRAYALAGIDYITPDPDGNQVFVSYSVDYEVADDKRTVRGRASYGAVIIDLHTWPRIAWIRENIQRSAALRQ